MLALAVGIWVTVAPSVLGYPQPAGAWGGSVLNDFWTGLGIVVTSGLALALYGATLRAQLLQAGVIAAAPPRREEPAGLGAASSADEGRRTTARGPLQEEPRAGSPSVEGVDDLLAPIATALPSELLQRRQGRLGGHVAAEGDGQR